MRLWSLDPAYLDTQGLVALWREALLAQKVLKGSTKGYRNHPQLIRFRARKDPSAAISTYLRGILNEALKRGYNFDSARIDNAVETEKMTVTEGQLLYELEHLKRKLQVRAPDRFEGLAEIHFPKAHPHFVAVPGEVEAWEIRFR